MSLFHSAVYSALYVAMREQEQCKAAAEAVADMYDVSPTVARCEEAIAGLKDAIELLHQGEADAAEQDRQIAADDARRARTVDDGDQIATMQRLNSLTGRLITQLADYNISQWQLNNGQADGMLHHLHGGSRTTIRDIANRLGITYGEAPHPYGSEGAAGVIMTAAGLVDGLPVRIWCLIAADPAPADVQDEDQPTPRPATPARGHGQDESFVNPSFVDQDEADDVRQIRREMAIEAGDDSDLDAQIAADDARAERRSHEHCPGCPNCTGYADPNEPDDEDDYTAEQLDGTACLMCGHSFAVGERALVATTDFGGRQQFIHGDSCPDDDTTQPAPSTGAST